jgi:hypothetical protein
MGGGILIKVGGKLKAAEEVFAVRHFLNGFEIYNKSPKIFKEPLPKERARHNTCYCFFLMTFHQCKHTLS